MKLILSFLNSIAILSCFFCHGNLLEMGKESYGGNPGILHSTLA